MSTTPFLLDLIHRITQRGTERFTKAYGGDLRPRQLAILRALEVTSGVSQTHLMKATGVDRSTTAEIMRRLVKRGLVKRRRSRQDARAYVLAITPEGSAALAAADRVLASVELCMLDELPEHQRTTFLAALERLAGRT